MNPEDVTITLRQLAESARQDAPYLFLGVALLTIALLAAGMLLIRRRRDPLLVYFALFALLYGLRLILQRGTLDMVFLGAEWFRRLREALNYLVPIPALLFFKEAGFVKETGFARYLARYGLYLFTALGSTLFVLTLILGRRNAFTIANNTDCNLKIGCCFTPMG